MRLLAIAIETATLPRQRATHVWYIGYRYPTLIGNTIAHPALDHSPYLGYRCLVNCRKLDDRKDARALLHAQSIKDGLCNADLPGSNECLSLRTVRTVIRAYISYALIRNSTILRST